MAGDPRKIPGPIQRNLGRTDEAEIEASLLIASLVDNRTVKLVLCKWRAEHAGMLDLLPLALDISLNEKRGAC